MIGISEHVLLHWHETGSALNAVGHRFNATGEIPGVELEGLLRTLRRLVAASFPAPLFSGGACARYALAPALRYHLRKTCTNLVQIADRFQSLGLLPPVPHCNLIRRFRTILNGDSLPHGCGSAPRIDPHRHPSATRCSSPPLLRYAPQLRP